MKTKGVPFMKWAAMEAVHATKREGRTVKLKPSTIVARVRNGLYRGMKLFRLNARRVFVVKPGKCRKLIPARERALSSPRGRSLHERVNESEPTPGKYFGWMQGFDCGHMTPRRDGGM